MLFPLPITDQTADVSPFLSWITKRMKKAGLIIIRERRVEEASKASTELGLSPVPSGGAYDPPLVQGSSSRWTNRTDTPAPGAQIPAPNKAHLESV